MLARSGSNSRRAGFSANVRSISASLSLWMAVLSSQEHHDGFATPTTSLPRDLVITTSSEILPSSEVMAINLPAPRERACSHRTSRLSSRSFRGVIKARVVVVCTAGFGANPERRGCHYLYQLFGVAALAHRGLPPCRGFVREVPLAFPAPHLHALGL